MQFETELAQPLKARDYKDPLVVIYELSKNDRGADGIRVPETWDAGSDE